MARLVEMIVCRLVQLQIVYSTYIFPNPFNQSPLCFILRPALCARICLCFACKFLSLSLCMFACLFVILYICWSSVIHFTLCTLHCALYIVHFTLYTLHCALYIVHFTLHCALYRLALIYRIIVLQI